MNEYGADLTNLFVRPGGPEFEVLQGEVVAWNVLSGANTIRVNGVSFPNLPFLSPGTAVVFYPGDAVMVLRMRNALFLLGRAVPAGFQQNAVGRFFTQPVGDVVNPGVSAGWSTTTTPAVKATSTMTVPDWGDNVTLFVSAWARALNSTAVVDFLNTRLTVNGSLDGTYTWEATSGSVPAAQHGAASFAYSWTLLRFAGGSAMSVQQSVWSTTGAWAANAANSCFMSVLPFVTSTG